MVKCKRLVLYNDLNHTVFTHLILNFIIILTRLFVNSGV